MKRRIDKGEDPLAEQQKARGAATVADLCDEFLAEHVANKRPSTKQEYTAIIKNIIRKELGRKQVAIVTTEDIEKLHRDVTKRAPYRANRVVAVASRMFTFAIKKKCAWTTRAAASSATTRPSASDTSSPANWRDW